MSGLLHSRVDSPGKVPFLLRRRDADQKTPFHDVSELRSLSGVVDETQHKLLDTVPGDELQFDLSQRNGLRRMRNHHTVTLVMQRPRQQVNGQCLHREFPIGEDPSRSLAFQ